MKINTRQLCFFCIFIVPVEKIISLPSLLARYSGNDLIISALINILTQAAVIFFTLKASERLKKGFYETLSSSLGSVFAKIIYFAFAAFFVFYSVMPLFEHKSYVQSAFYDTAPALPVFTPFFLFCVFACAKGIRSLGRISDLSAPLFLISFLPILFMAIPSADITALLPFMKTPLSSVIKGSAYTLNWFGDSAFILLLTDVYEAKRKDAVKITGSYLIGALTVTALLAVFYGIFQGLASEQHFAVTKIAAYYGAVATIGRIDYILSYSLAAVLLFYLALPAQMSVHCLNKVFGEKKLLFPIIVTLICAVIVYIFNYKTEILSEIINEKLFFIFSLFLFALPFLYIFARRKNEEK